MPAPHHEAEPGRDRTDDLAETMRLLSRYDQGVLWCYLDREERLEQHLLPDLGDEAKRVVESLLALPAEELTREHAVRDIGPARVRQALSAALSPPRSPLKDGLRTILPGVMFRDGELIFLLDSISYGLTGLKIESSIFFLWPDKEPFWPESEKGQVLRWDSYRGVSDDLGTPRTNHLGGMDRRAVSPYGGMSRILPPLTVSTSSGTSRNCTISNNQVWYPGIPLAASTLKVLLPTGVRIYLPGGQERLLASLSIPDEEVIIQLPAPRWPGVNH